MNSTIKNIIILFLITFLLKSCIITNPKPDDCEVKSIQVSSIYEGGVKDIIFAEENGDFYYINRGLERGYSLKEMEQLVLNKTVTLHLPKLITGNSNHIAQLVIDDQVIYSEFTILPEKAILKE